MRGVAYTECEGQIRLILRMRRELFRLERLSLYVQFSQHLEKRKSLARREDVINDGYLYL